MSMRHEQRVFPLWKVADPPPEIRPAPGERRNREWNGGEPVGRLPEAMGNDPYALWNRREGRGDPFPRPTNGFPRRGT